MAFEVPVPISATVYSKPSGRLIRARYRLLRKWIGDRSALGFDQAVRFDVCLTGVHVDGNFTSASIGSFSTSSRLHSAIEDVKVRGAGCGGFSVQDLAQGLTLSKIGAFVDNRLAATVALRDFAWPP